jgi:hypothetical protein
VKPLAAILGNGHIGFPDYPSTARRLFVSSEALNKNTTSVCRNSRRISLRIEWQLQQLQDEKIMAYVAFPLLNTSFRDVVGLIAQ